MKMEPEIMEGLLKVWEEKSNINKSCSRQTRGGFIFYHDVGIVIKSQVVHMMQQPLCHGDPICNEWGNPENVIVHRFISTLFVSERMFRVTVCKIMFFRNSLVLLDPFYQGFGRK